MLALLAAVQAQYTYTTNDGTASVTRYTGSGGAVAIPEVIDGLRVTGIRSYAFASSTNLTNVTIPNSVKSPLAALRV